MLPLVCPLGGGQMRIIAFIIDGHEVGKILEYIGVDAEPPRITLARGPPLWDEGDAQASDGKINNPVASHGESQVETGLEQDPSAQIEPDYQYDQRISW